jgi:hypothetical protein
MRRDTSWRAESIDYQGSTPDLCYRMALSFIGNCMRGPGSRQDSGHVARIQRSTTIMSHISEPPEPVDARRVCLRYT